MNERSIEAYDVPARVAAYDADMDLMHPNRHKMVQVALEVLPFSANAPLRGLDLGIGTGFFTARFLERFPQARVTAVDGAQAMTDLARLRLGASAGRVRFQIGDFRQLRDLAATERPFDVVFSSFALHHLGREDKQRVLADVVASLKPGGWFINADILAAESPEMEERFQQLRAEGIVERARRANRLDPHFANVAGTRKYLADMQADEGDQPLTIQEDLQLLRDAGLGNAIAFWLEYREAVMGASRLER